VVFPDATGDVVIGGNSRIGYSTLARFSSLGDLVWARDTGTQRQISLGASTGNGRVFTAGSLGSGLALAEYDALGNRLWAVTHTPSLASNTLTDLAVAADAAGQPTAIYVCGYVNQGTVRESDPFVLKCDPAGAVVWSHVYTLPGDDEINALALLADGTLLLAGSTGADVAVPTPGTPALGNITTNGTANGLLLKVSSDDGAMLWAHTYAGRTLVFQDVVEAPDGTVYAGGSATRTVAESRPVIAFARFAADGTLLDHVLVGDDPDLPDELPTGGNSPYDGVARIAWAEEGLVACGNTGLGPDQAGWVMTLTDELGVKYYSVIDGTRSDTFFDVAADMRGIAVAATTDSLFPWAGSGTAMPWLLKLPWEGLMRFHPDTAARALVLGPQVYHSSADPDFQIIATVETPGAPPQSFSNRQSPVLFTRTGLTWSPATAPVAPTPPLALTHLAVEQVDAGLVEDFDDWTLYHNLTGDDAVRTADTDEDGLPLVLEAFFGRSPHVAEPEPPVTVAVGELNDQPVVVFTFERTTATRSLGVTFETSEAADTWIAAAGLTEVVQPLASDRQRVQLIAARDLPAKFFRFAAAAAAP
jgi:hypothetical protein